MSFPINMRFSTASRFAAFGLAVFAIAAVCPAQQTPAPAASGTVLRLQAREVVLPVTVRDKHGALVTTLQKSDFTLSEDGRPQVIKSFAHESNLPFRLGLLVDTSRSMSNVMQPVRDATGKFVDLMLPAPPASGTAPQAKAKDEAFLIHFDRQVELLQDFTNSREKLHHELDGMTASQEERYEGTDSGGGSSDDHARHNRGGTQLYDAILSGLRRTDEIEGRAQGAGSLFRRRRPRQQGDAERRRGCGGPRQCRHLHHLLQRRAGARRRGRLSRGRSSRGGMGGGYPGGGGGYPSGGHRGGQPTGANGVDGKKIMQQIADRTGGHAFEAKKKDDLEPFTSKSRQSCETSTCLPTHRTRWTMRAASTRSRLRPARTT